VNRAGLAGWYDRSMSDTMPDDTMRVTVTLPASLVRELDAQLVNGYASRDEAVRHLIEDALSRERARLAREAARRAESEQYVREWRENPLTEDEIGWADRAVAAAMSDEPWE